MTIALTRFTLGFHVLFVRLCEWETFIPKVTPFPQISHFAIRLHLLNYSSYPPAEITAELDNMNIVTHIREKCKPFLKKNLNFFIRP